MSFFLNTAICGFSLYHILAFFLIYSCLGWCLEVVYAAATTGQLVNRGFLNGPVCPIYGFGMILVLFFLTPLEDSLLLLYLGGVLLPSALELVGGWVLYKLYRTRWWDYSDMPFNIGGYICLEFSLLWGVGALLMVKAVHPAIAALVDIVPPLVGFILMCLLYAVYAADVVATGISASDLARELDARVAERTKELTAETDARKSMMLNIFHDLRSPLFAVSNGLETLESAPEALPALLPALRQRVEFLRRLTEDLFLAAKLEQKQLLLNEDRAALNEEAAAVCAACQSEAAQKGVALCLSADVLLPVWGDSVRLQQILQNLVTNAIHYTPAGGSIHVVCRAEGGTACVSVQDTGCGIAPEDQGAVFDRYFHTSADKKHDSTGLGLTIAQELARLHHGEITLQSEVGRGSIFTLRLPLLNIEEYSSLRFYRKTRN